MESKIYFYSLILLYCGNKISINEFCDAFHISYIERTFTEHLDEKEQTYFDEIFERVTYFNENVQERMMTGNLYTSEDDIKKEIDGFLIYLLDEQKRIEKKCFLGEKIDDILGEMKKNIK